jgi:hypothetical protein
MRQFLVSRGSGQKRVHSAMINLADNLSHNSAVLQACFSDNIYFSAFILLEPLEHSTFMASVTYVVLRYYLNTNVEASYLMVAAPVPKSKVNSR